MIKGDIPMDLMLTKKRTDQGCESWGQPWLQRQWDVGVQDPESWKQQKWQTTCDSRGEDYEGVCLEKYMGFGPRNMKGPGQLVDFKDHLCQAQEQTMPMSFLAN